MAYLGVKLGRHTVQASLWSENLGRPVEAHLPGLEVESASWHPVLGRDTAGKLTWGEDLWTHLRGVSPLDESLLSLLDSGGDEIQHLLQGHLWPEMLRLAEKSLRGGEKHSLGIAATLAPSAALREGLAGSLPPELELAGVEHVSVCALAGARAEMGEALAGRVLQVHLGGAEAQVSLWEAENSADRLQLRGVRQLREPDASVGAILHAVSERLMGEWGLLHLEEAASREEEELVRRLRRDILRRLAETRATWEVAWQYEAPLDLRHLVRWVPVGPMPLPSAGMRAAITGAGAALMSGVDAVLKGDPDPVRWVIATGAGASDGYLLSQLQERFGRERCPLPARAEALPAMGAAALARWRAADSPLQVEIVVPTDLLQAPEPRVRPEEVSIPEQPHLHPSELLPQRSALGLSIAPDGVSVGWTGSPSGTEILAIQGRRTIPATVALDREDPSVRHWGALAEALQSEGGRYALIRSLPMHVGTGARFVVSRKGGAEAPGFTPEALLDYLLAQVSRNVRDALRRRAAGEPTAALCCFPPEWSPEAVEDARGRLRDILEVPVRPLPPAAAAWISALPDQKSESGAVLLVKGSGISAAMLRRGEGAGSTHGSVGMECGIRDPVPDRGQGKHGGCPYKGPLTEAGGWEVVRSRTDAGYGADFAAEVLARFLTDELNGRFARNYRYTDLVRASPGTELRALGEGLRQGGEELAERLIRAERASHRLELRLPGGGTALFEPEVTREQWDGWAGRRIRESLGRVLPEVLGDDRPARLLLAGNGAAIPLFRGAAEIFCAPLGIPVELHPQPEIAPALGAAMAAAEWARIRGSQPPGELVILAAEAHGDLARQLVTSAGKHGIRAVVASEGEGGEETARVAVALLDGGLDGPLRQEVERALRKGLPVLPLRLDPSSPGATAGASTPLETLSQSEPVTRLLDQVRRLLGPEGK